jgi:Putative Ig domain
MRIKFGVVAALSIFTLVTLMIVPTYADVTSISMKKSFYTIDELISFFGTESDGNSVINIVVRDPNGKAALLGGFSDSDGNYETIPKTVKSVFSVNGIYNVTAFTDKIENSKSMQVEFNGDRVDLIPDFVLTLNSISDKTVEAKKTLVFTATVADSVADVVFSLENAPTGASINSETGQFTWTPTESQSPGSYLVDVIVQKGSLEDRQTIKITVTKPVVAQPEPTPTPVPEPTPEPQPTPEPTKELGIASFVDPTKDPQSYVDRYNKEPTYKKWFDTNFPQYSSIYEAVGLAEPKPLASFVDPTKDPQSYVDRYNKEPTYKKWFDTNFPQYSSIYEAVGLAEPETTKPETTESEIGQCGPGTTLVGDTCVVENTQKGGGCLIATATYGSEMAPQVQFLREIRDSKVMSTASGVSFMTAFNSFYYSFSPTVADLERENPMFKEVVKIGITPMLSSLSIMSAADSEQEILTYGIGVILMNVGMYFVAPVMIVYSIKKAKTRLSF